MCYYNDPYCDDDEAYERDFLRDMFGDDWIEDDDPYREAFDGNPDAYWNID